MPHELWVALCLVLVLEGLVLFAAPRGWQRLMREAAQMAPERLRLIGLGSILCGALVLRLLY